MKRLLCLMAALALLGACGAQVAPEETTARTTEVPTTTQAIVPLITPEEAEQIVEDFIGEKARLLGIRAWDISEDGRYYYVQASCHWESDGVLYRGNYCVDVITGDLFAPNRSRGEVVGASLPLKHICYVVPTAEQYQAAETAAEVFFLGEGEYAHVYEFVQREGREYCLYGIDDIIRHDGYFVYCDLETQELFLWNLDTDTLTPYSPA